MKIGLDYGGVISFAPDGWVKAIKKAQSKGHEFYLVSHYQNYEDNTRIDFAKKAGMINLSFSDLKSESQEKEIAQRKAELCQQYGIEIFIDDDLHRAEAVGRFCDRCAAFYIPQNLWQIGQRIIEALGNESEEWR